MDLREREFCSEVELEWGETSWVVECHSEGLIACAYLGEGETVGCIVGCLVGDGQFRGKE